MLSERKQEERILRKKAILDGALKVFNEEGIDKTTMDHIAHESGFGKATLYYYFSSKDEVFIAIMEDGWKKMWEGIESQIIEDLNPRKKFMGFVKTMGSIVTKDKILYEFLFTAPNYIQESDKQTWKTYQQRLYAILQSNGEMLDKYLTERKNAKKVAKKFTYNSGKNPERLASPFKTGSNGSIVKLRRIAIRKGFKSLFLGFDYNYMNNLSINFEIS